MFCHRIITIKLHYKFLIIAGLYFVKVHENMSSLLMALTNIFKIKMDKISTYEENIFCKFSQIQCFRLYNHDLRNKCQICFFFKFIQAGSKSRINGWFMYFIDSYNHMCVVMCIFHGCMEGLQWLISWWFCKSFSHKPLPAFCRPNNPCAHE